MVLTGARATGAFDHVIANVFPANIDNTSPLVASLNLLGIKDIISLSLMPEEDIQALEYADDQGTMLDVPYYQKQVLSIFLIYLQHRDSLGTSVADDEWTRLTAADFDEFRTSPVGRSYGRRTNGARPRLPHSAPAAATTSPPALSEVDMFKRGIKRDMTLYPKLNDEKRQDAWHHTFLNQARAQDVADILNKDYTHPAGRSLGDTAPYLGIDPRGRHLPSAAPRKAEPACCFQRNIPLR